MKKILFVCHSSAHILYSLQISRQLKKQSEDIQISFYLSDWIVPKLRKSMKTYIGDMIEHSKCFSFKEINHSKSLSEKYFRVKFEEYLSKSVKVFLYLDVFPSGAFLLRNNDDNILVYEGLATYKNSNNSIKCNVRRFFFKPRSWGHSSKIKKIMVPHPEFLPKKLQKKSEKINFDSLDFNSKDIYWLKKIFNVAFSDKAETKKILILTQPFYVEKMLSRENQLTLYTDIINKYQLLGYFVYFKSHPRDKIDYSFGMVEGCEFLESSFPVELLLLLNCRFDKIISISSSANDNLKKLGEVIGLGVGYLDKYK